MPSMHIIDIVIRLGASVAVGAIVGLQREYKRNSAGFRTHMLVAIGACIAMMTNEYLLIAFGDVSKIDVARMASYVISGIGFLGAGSIIKDKSGIRGLTTAAGLWVTACLGITAGAGFYWAAIIGSAFVFLIITVFKLLERKIFKSKKDLKVVVACTEKELPLVLEALKNIGAKIDEVKVSTDGLETGIRFTLTKQNRTDMMIEVSNTLLNFKVRSIKIL